MVDPYPIGLSQPVGCDHVSIFFVKIISIGNLILYYSVLEILLMYQIE